MWELHHSTCTIAIVQGPTGVVAEASGQGPEAQGEKNRRLGEGENCWLESGWEWILPFFDHEIRRIYEPILSPDPPIDPPPSLIIILPVLLINIWWTIYVSIQYGMHGTSMGIDRLKKRRANHMESWPFLWWFARVWFNFKCFIIHLFEFTSFPCLLLMYELHCRASRLWIGGTNNFQTMGFPKIGHVKW